MTQEEKKRKNDLFMLILKKSGMSYNDFLMLVKHNYIASNLDILTAAERRKYRVNA